MFFLKELVLVLEMAVLERLQWKHSLKPLGVNNLACATLHPSKMTFSPIIPHKSIQILLKKLVEQQGTTHPQIQNKLKKYNKYFCS